MLGHSGEDDAWYATLEENSHLTGLVFVLPFVRHNCYTPTSGICRAFTVLQLFPPVTLSKLVYPCVHSTHTYMTSD